MIKFLKTILFFLLGSNSLFAQSEIDSWVLNTSGTLAVYDTLPGPPRLVIMSALADVTAVCYDTSHVYVEAEGLASHLMGMRSNPNILTAQGYTFRVPRKPWACYGTN